MKSILLNTVYQIHSLLICVIVLFGCSPDQSQNNLSEGMATDEPGLFAEGIISTKLNELNATFSPDGNLFLYTIANNSYANTFYTIFMSRKEDGRWSEPSIAPFSGQYSDADPFFAPDGSGVYFISYRPADSAASKSDFDIWFAAYENNSFVEPVRLGNDINSELDELYPSAALKGNLYFSRENGSTGYDIMVSKRVDGVFTKPISVSDSINTTATEYDAYIAPDESYILFTAIGRKDGLGSGDLYVSLQKEGIWTRGANLGPEINSGFMDQCPAISPDGRFLFFTSFRENDSFRFKKQNTTLEYLKLLDSPLNGMGNIYWMKNNIVPGTLKNNDHALLGK